MKNKKLIAFISAVCMSLTAVPSVVFADEDIPDYSVETIVDSGDEPGVNADAGMDAGEDTEVLEEQPVTDYDIESDGDVYAATIAWPATTGIKTYCKSTGNDTPVYQTPTSTNGKYGTIYSTDLITIIGYDKSSKRYKVSYPKTGTDTRKTGYVAASNITSAAYNVAQSKTKATAKITTYRRSDGKLELGYISKNDTYYVIATSGNYKQVIYPISGGYKMGWIKTTTSNPTPTTAPSGSWQYPVKGYSVSQTFGHNGHLGIDLTSSSDKTIYAAANGTVSATGLNGTGTDASTTKNPKGNGYYVVIKHTIGSKTVYSFYGHLKKGSIKVKAGDTVKKGDSIATMGNTGNSTGTHLHFAIADTYKEGTYYGYTSDYKTFSANKKKESRSSVTFYNGEYVIKNGKLPS